MQFTSKEKKIIDNVERYKQKIKLKYTLGILLIFTGIYLCIRGAYNEHLLDISSGNWVIWIGILAIGCTRRIDILHSIIIKYKNKSRDAH